MRAVKTVIDDQPRDRRTWRRPLRVLPFDPMVDRGGRTVIADVMYEQVHDGPAGRLVEVIDYDPVHRCFYQPIDLDDPEVLLDCGLDVSEDDPRFHQQMVYAVVMRVLETFERGLGRPFRWRGNRRLRVFPHAFAGENAYFDEDLFALLFGYFTASPDNPGANLPNQVVFTALSHDIVAHETTHAVLKRLRPHYSNPTNPDVLAFHEGFADIIAILQHFTYPDIVAEHIAASRADLTDPMTTDSPMLSLASQFGYARGDNTPLRTALMEAKPTAYTDATEEHDRGAVLVASVIDGFLRSYQQGIADLVRIATAGTGVLRPGALDPDLVRRIADVASQTAERITTICVRAFDYLPPVDLTFSDYLRALVTADFDLHPDDQLGLRANLIEGFRRRGIYPTGVSSLSQRSLRIEPVPDRQYDPVPLARERVLDAAREFDRRRRSNVEFAVDPDAGPTPFDPMTGEQPDEWADPSVQASWAKELHAWAMKHHKLLGLDRAAPIAVDGFFTGQRMDSDGYLQSLISVQFVQRDKDAAGDLGGIVAMGGATVIADGQGNVRYVVTKPLPTAGSPRRVALASFAAEVEHRTPAVAWSPDAATRIIQHMNLRSIDARRT